MLDLSKDDNPLVTCIAVNINSKTDEDLQGWQEIVTDCE